MIVAVGGDKGAPGATTVAVLLALAWPDESVLVELDLRGATLPYRVQANGGRPLARTPSVASLAVDARPGSAPPSLERYAQLTELGVAAIPGLVTVPNEVDAEGRASGSRARAALARCLPAIAAAGHAWRGTAIADVGELLPGNPAVAVARAAEVTLLVTRATTEGLGRLWERAVELVDALGDIGQGTPPLGVVLVSEHAHAAEAQARAVLDLVGCPAPVVGTVAFDPRAAAQLWAGGGGHLRRSSLYRSGQRVVERIFELWPETLAQSSGLARLAGQGTVRVEVSDNAGGPVSPVAAGWAEGSAIR